MNFMTASFSNLYGSQIQDNGEPTQEKILAMTRGVELNNAAYVAHTKKDYKTALEKYKEAISIKLNAYGEDSLHICISLSGLSDVYLDMGDLENARKEANRMLKIAKNTGNPEQIRIAKEILTDISKASK